MKKPVIILFYAIPLHSNKASNWVDGFTSAIDRLKKDFDFIYHNINEQPIPTDGAFYDNIDLIFIKANWSARLELQAQKNLLGINVPKALLISGSKVPPSSEHALFYDLLYYETSWYKQCITFHSNIIHAFGIDRSKMIPLPDSKKTIDVLSIGSYKKYKRLHLLISKKGRKVFIGEKPKKITYRNLQDYFFYFLIKLFRIETIDYVDYSLLCQYINQSKLVYIPASLQGGGERAVLEARSCGTPVEVEEDNPKLMSLVRGKIYDSEYYAEQLKEGILRMI